MNDAGKPHPFHDLTLQPASSASEGRSDPFGLGLAKPYHDEDGLYQGLEPFERRVNKGGYIQVKVPVPYENYPAACRLIAEHRLVMEVMLGRGLEKGESIHHKNGIRDDNRPQNLELWIGGIRYGQRAAEVKCPHCGEAYHEEPGETRRESREGKGTRIYLTPEEITFLEHTRKTFGSSADWKAHLSLARKLSRAQRRIRKES